MIKWTSLDGARSIHLGYYLDSGHIEWCIKIRKSAIPASIDATSLSMGILACLNRENPVKAKETTFPVKVEDDREFKDRVYSVSGIIDKKSPAGGFREGVQWMLDQIHASESTLRHNYRVQQETIEEYRAVQKLLGFPANTHQAIIDLQAACTSAFERGRGYERNTPKPKQSDDWVEKAAEEIYNERFHYSPVMREVMQEMAAIIRKHAPKTLCQD